MTQPLEVVVLAAGQGTRMKSDRPKVLHRLAGCPLLDHVLRAAESLGPGVLHVVYGHGGEHVREAFAGRELHWVAQTEQLGTGHAVAQVEPALADDALVLILYGDVPLIRPQTLQRLVAAAEGDRLALLTAILPDPTGYGRIVREDERVRRIVEHKDASDAIRAIHEVNTGMMALSARQLKGWLTRIGNDNAQGEYYLTDIIGLADADGVPIGAVVVDDNDEVLGINDRLQLAHLERVHQRREAERLMRDGLTLIDPARFDLRGSLRVGRDCVIDVNVVIEGDVVLGDRVKVSANCVLKDAVIGDDVDIEPMSVLESCQVAGGCHIGPFARLRPGTELATGARIGNFVEVKKSTIGPGSKVNHLSYIGDTRMGGGVNIGAGTITCNYDGANKHQTVIGDNAFIGSDTQLVAPVEVGAGATIGAGSTITRNAPADELTLSRNKQQTVKGWKRPEKKVKSEK